MYDDDVDRFRIDSYEITAEDVKDKAYYKLTINYKEGSSQQSITSFERCEYKLKPTEGDDCEFYGSNYVVETSDLTAKDSPYERFVPLNEAPTLKGAIDLSSLLKEVDGLTRSPGPNRGKSPCQLKEESR